MKATITLFFILIYFLAPAQNNEKELAKIEETRNGFMLAIKEKRYQDLTNFTTSDMETIGPASEGFLEMYEIGKERGAFPYDRIIMTPKETVIVSDSIAYDYGTSEVYYTNTLGEQKLLTNSYLVILKKDTKGTWRLHREVASGQVKQSNN
ncbi:hypothetical protein MG296_13240 [Flavobacteriaceae bacterium TK19130]|nr:hypothetical protein [Thermobacterium salinum]